MSEEVTAQVNETAEVKTKIKLWNPSAVNYWGVLFTPIFGAWLQSKNWVALGDANQAKKSMYWVYGGFALLFFGIFLVDFQATLPASLIFLLAWYFSTSNKQIKHVKENLNNDYEHTSWKEPMKFAFIGLAIVFIIVWITTSSVTVGIEKKSFAILIIIIIGVILLYRDIVCWVWKINRIVALLESINEAVGGESPSVMKKTGNLFEILESKIDKQSAAKETNPPSTTKNNK